jgi:hypothetical protein
LRGAKRQSNPIAMNSSHALAQMHDDEVASLVPRSQ